MLGQSISKNAWILSLFAVLSAALVAAIALNTRDNIAQNMRKAEEKALLEIIPRAQHDNSMLDDSLDVDDQELLGLRESKKLYIAKHNGQSIAVIVPATARDGYTGDIQLIVGVRRDGTVAGVRVLAHRETPGLGDKIDYRKSRWLDGFVGRSLGNPSIERWKVKKDQGEFDQFTGATVTPRAVTKAVRQALEYVAQQRAQLFTPTKTAADGASL